MLFLHQLTAEPSVTLNASNISFMKQECLTSYYRYTGRGREEKKKKTTTTNNNKQVLEDLKSCHIKDEEAWNIFSK